MICSIPLEIKTEGYTMLSPLIFTKKETLGPFFYMLFLQLTQMIKLEREKVKHLIMSRIDCRLIS